MIVMTTVTVVAKELLRAFLLDVTFLPFYIIALLFIRKEYKKYREHLAGACDLTLNDTGSRMEETILFGLIGGFAVSLFSVSLEINVHLGVIKYLFLTMVALALVSPRRLCFPYAVGIFCLIGRVFSLPEMSARNLLMLAAVVHMIESILIFFFGAKGAVPVYIKHREGIAGAFMMRKLWPMPLVLLVLIPGGDGMQLEAASLVAGLDCVLGFSGYSDVAVTMQPVKKCRRTAIWYFAYSTLLLLFSVLSEQYSIFTLIGALFAVAGHEGITQYASFREKNGHPIFIPVKRGLRVLEVVPGSHAEKMGMKRGEVILRVNNRGIQTVEGLNEALKQSPSLVWIDVLDMEEREKTYQYRCFPEGMDRLGIISVPREREITYNIDSFHSFTVITNLVVRFRSMNRQV